MPTGWTGSSILTSQATAGIAHRGCPPLDGPLTPIAAAKRIRRRGTARAALLAGWVEPVVSMARNIAMWLFVQACHTQQVSIASYEGDDLTRPVACQWLFTFSIHARRAGDEPDAAEAERIPEFRSTRPARRAT